MPTNTNDIIIGTKYIGIGNKNMMIGKNEM